MAQVAPLRAACPPAARFIMVTATLAASVFAQLTQEFPGILPAFGPGKPCNSLFLLVLSFGVHIGNSEMVVACIYYDVSLVRHLKDAKVRHICPNLQEHHAILWPFT